MDCLSGFLLEKNLVLYRLYSSGQAKSCCSNHHQIWRNISLLVHPHAHWPSAGSSFPSHPHPGAEESIAGFHGTGCGETSTSFPASAQKWHLIGQSKSYGHAYVQMNRELLSMLRRRVRIFVNIHTSNVSPTPAAHLFIGQHIRDVFTKVWNRWREREAEASTDKLWLLLPYVFNKWSLKA